MEKILKLITGFLIIICLISAGCFDSGKTENKDKSINKNIYVLKDDKNVISQTEKAIQEYNIDSKIETVSNSKMKKLIAESINNNSDINIAIKSTNPLYNDSKLKFLNDSKNIFNSESIKSISSHGFNKQHPNAYNIIRKYNLTQNQKQTILDDTDKELTLKESSFRWASKHPTIVNNWINEHQIDKKEKLIAVYPKSNDAAVYMHVLEYALEKAGYRVTSHELEIDAVYKSLNKSNADFSPYTVLPNTHSKYIDNNNNVNIIGNVSSNVKIGIMKPIDSKYNSINEL